MSNGTFGCPILSEEDKFTTCETAGPADQLTPVDAFEITWNCCSVILSIILWGYIVICVVFSDRYPINDPLVIIFFGIIPYYIYLSECRQSKTLQYLDNVITFEKLVQEIDTLRQARPKWSIRVHCWHKAEKDATVTTVSETIDFPYDEGEDLTRFDFAGMTVEDLIPSERGGGNFVLVDLPQFLCMNETMLENYDRLTSEKYEQNKDRDGNIAVYTIGTPHPEQRMLMLKEDCLVSSAAYWFCSILVLSMPYRIFFQLKTDNMVLPIRMKVI